MVYVLCALCAVLALAVLLLVWKIVLLRRSAEELRQGLQERLEEDTNTLLSISSRDSAMCRLAAGLNAQLRLLRQERRQYQSGDRTLKDTVTNISHDLRTPLTAICGYLDLLEGEEKSEAAARYLELIRGRTDHLRSLTEEFFRTSAVLAAQESGEPEEVSLNRAVEEALAAWYGTFSAKGIAPEVELPEEPVVRRLDREALARILSNILSNAAKYSPGDLRVSLTADGTLTFSNTAPGLTPVLAQRLFDRYFTVETGREAGGLGLSIARQMAEQMGGWADAQYQDGTLAIRVHFPQGQPCGGCQSNIGACISGNKLV